MTPITIWIAMVCYSAGVSCLLAARRQPRGRRVAIARWCWTAGAAALCLHLAAAFAEHYHWSHAEAVRQTEARTREWIGAPVGMGIWFNYAAAVVWLIDSLWWWRVGQERYRAAGHWSWAAHGFLAFMMFNGGVVFVGGWRRLAGAALLTAPLLSWGLAAWLPDQGSGKTPEDRRPRG